ncbi:MAG: gamma-glutamyl-gamma-aminobutyrate hydrolase family protein [Actinomycetota bacterium]|nr:gamma-glutamyl-gamma-aminobutyrate hydrolase family protein [Actinomycetota bacterium]
MKPTCPLVAIPTYHLPAGRVLGWMRGGYAVPDGYVAAVERAGALPVLLPPADGPPAEEVLLAFDALLLAGGGDVEPARYGAQPHPQVYGVDSVRDEAELALVRAAMELGLPTLVICRGLQVLNVALGGSLYQHLPELEGMDLHGHPRETASVVHDVKVAPGTRLADACASEVLRCTSHHHQGIDRLGDGLGVVAMSGDGLIEGVEPADADAPWLVGVQWHPELTAAEDPFQQALFDGLVAQARARCGTRTGQLR